MADNSNSQKDIDCAVHVLMEEAKALETLASVVDGEFHRAVESVHKMKQVGQGTGRLIVAGIGKSGHVARKIAATLSSTGTPAFFVHPGEASHGDMGMVVENDVFLAVSKSGGNEEVTRIIPYLKALKVKIISITSSADSKLAKESDVVLLINVKQEAGSIGVVPTTTTTVSLVMGDALAVAVSTKKNFGREDFALLHPGGALGRKLFLKVAEALLPWRGVRSHRNA